MSKYIYIFMCLILLIIGIILVIFDQVVGGSYGMKYGGMQQSSISGYPLILVAAIMLIPGLMMLTANKPKPIKNKKTRKSQI